MRAGERLGGEREAFSKLSVSDIGATRARLFDVEVHSERVSDSNRRVLRYSSVMAEEKSVATSC